LDIAYLGTSIQYVLFYLIFLQLKELLQNLQSYILVMSAHDVTHITHDIRPVFKTVRFVTWSHLLIRVCLGWWI